MLKITTKGLYHALRVIWSAKREMVPRCGFEATYLIAPKSIAMRLVALRNSFNSAVGEAIVTFVEPVEIDVLGYV